MSPKLRRRNKLITEGMGIVPGIALRVKRTVGRTIELDDLVAAGYEGLVDAATRFDPKRGVKFVTFGYTRVCGAIIDHVRHLGIYTKTDVEDLKAGRSGPRSFVDINGKLPIEIPSEIPHPDELLAMKRRYERLVFLIDQLPTKQRAIIRSYYIDGASLEEAGRAIGLSKSWTSRIVKQTVKDLSELM